MKVRQIALYFIIVFLTSCSMLPTITNEEAVVQRVKARWQAIIENKWNEAYQFETKGYRQSHSAEQFKAKFGSAVSWKQVKVLKVDINEQETSANIKINISFATEILGMGLQNLTADQQETWLLDDGEWWHYKRVH